jgi:hypothetical protein
MKIKSWSKYLIYIILICLLIILREYIEKQYTHAYYRLENSAILSYVLISLLLGMCVGLFLGLEHFMKEFRKAGMWKINVPRLIIIGLPSLYFSLTKVWMISGSQLIHEVTTYPLFFLFGLDAGHVTLFQIIVGYVAITSFFKYSENI